jgi:hypothetical protein
MYLSGTLSFSNGIVINTASSQNLLRRGSKFKRHKSRREPLKFDEYTILAPRTGKNVYHICILVLWKRETCDAVGWILVSSVNRSNLLYFRVYFYSKTKKMHNISNLFHFGTSLYMFRTVFPSIIRNLRLYIQHQVYVIQVLWLLASRQTQNRNMYSVVPK